MNAQNAHEFLPLVQALADGKTLQYKRDSWVDAEELDTIYHVAREYRIKPEPRTFEIVRSKLTKDIYSAENYDGGSPNIWEYITVMEVLK